MANCGTQAGAFYDSNDEAIYGKDYFHEYLCCWMRALMQAKGYGMEIPENEATYYHNVSVIRETLGTGSRGLEHLYSLQNDLSPKMPFDKYAILEEYQGTEKRQLLLPRKNTALFEAHEKHNGQQQQHLVGDPQFQRKRVHGPYTCEDCGKVLKRSSSLSNHRLIHKNVKAFRCDKCGARFLRKSDLGKHFAIHTGSKPYVCNICDKSFSQSSNMLTHKRRHTGVKPFKCEYCAKSFYRKVDVKRHEIVHNISEGE